MALSRYMQISIMLSLNGHQSGNHTLSLLIQLAREIEADYN